MSTYFKFIQISFNLHINKRFVSFVSFLKISSHNKCKINELSSFLNCFVIYGKLYTVGIKKYKLFLFLKSSIFEYLKFEKKKIFYIF